MNNWRKEIRKISLVKSFASIKITVVCLFLLFVLTFWGTVSQLDIGLYASQEKYFSSWYFLAFGFLPFPGARLLLWILFLNLLSNSVIRFVYRWSHLGILVIHLGLLTYFISAFVTFHGVVESNVTFFEGEKTNVSQSYQDWELSVWEETEEEKNQVYAFDVKGLQSGDVLNFSPLDIKFKVHEYYSNAKAYVQNEPGSQDFFNASGISRVTKTKLLKEPEQNVPALIISDLSKEDSQKALVYGAEARPASIRLNGKDLNVQLRRKRFQLPIYIRLDDFKMEQHPGTEIAKSFESFVTIEDQTLERQVRIYMNNPLRFKNYTFYQASYAIDETGREQSTLAVVKNTGRLLPYISSLITSVGLLIHFLVMAFRRSRKVEASV